MDRCALHTERSIALHAAVAAKLLGQPVLIERARAKLSQWLAAGGRSSPLWRRWGEILDRPLDEVCAFLVERSEEADWLRKASPFAGILTPQERWRILRETRAGTRA